jgi:hypothetical protein
MSAHGGKADKTGGHKLFSVPPGGGSHTQKPRAIPAYTKVNAPVAPPAQGLGMAGQKALIIRAKKELAPLEDPTQNIAE